MRRSSDKAYEYLSRLKTVDYEIMRAESRKKELESCLLPESTNYEKSKVKKSTEDRMAKIYADVEEAKQCIVELQRKKHAILTEISTLIEKLEDEQEKTILTLYWISNDRIYEIAKKMNYSTSKIYASMQSGMKKVEILILHPENDAGGSGSKKNKTV